MERNGERTERGASPARAAPALRWFGMTRLTLDDSREGLADFPDSFQPVARDDGGVVLAVDTAGVLWCFAHGMGSWSSRTRAFDSSASMHDYIANQADLDLIEPEETIEALQARKARVAALKQRLRSSPYARDATRQLLEELREAIADRRFWQSKRGKSLAARQAIGVRCKQALHEACVPGEWIVGAQGPDSNLIGVYGPFVEPWTEARVLELLAPLVDGPFELRCFATPSR